MCDKLQVIENMKRESITKNFLYNVAFQVVNLMLPLITTPYVSNVLGPKNIGIYSYTYAYISSFILIGSLGIATYAQREIAASTNVEAQSRKFWEIFCVKLITLGITVLFFLLFAFTSHEYTFYYLLQIPYFVAAMLDISWYYQGIEIFKKVSIRNILTKVIGLILILLFVKKEQDLYLYVLILCLTQLGGNLTMWVNLRKYLVKVKIKELDLVIHIKPACVYFVPTVAYQIYAVLDKAMLGFLGHDIYQNGYYEQAHKLVNISMTVIGSYNSVLRSRMSAYFAEKNFSDVKKYMNRSLHIVSFLIYPMMTGLAGISNNIVPWFFGEEFYPVIHLLMIFSPMFVIQGLRTCIGSHLITPRGSAVQSKVNYGSVVSAIVNVVLNSLLIPKFAAIGAVIASLVSELAMLITCLLLTTKYISVRQIILAGWKYFVAAMVMFIPIYHLAHIFPAEIAYSLLIVLCGVSVYLIALYVLRDRLVRDIIDKGMLKIKKVISP